MFQPGNRVDLYVYNIRVYMYVFLAYIVDVENIVKKGEVIHDELCRENIKVIEMFQQFPQRDTF